jgi:hypothetical protein
MNIMISGHFFEDRNIKLINYHSKKEFYIKKLAKLFLSFIGLYSFNNTEFIFINSLFVSILGMGFLSSGLQY